MPKTRKAVTAQRRQSWSIFDARRRQIIGKIRKEHRFRLAKTVTPRLKSIAFPAP
jgi:hypothetical protein